MSSEAILQEFTRFDTYSPSSHYLIVVNIMKVTRKEYFEASAQWLHDNIDDLKQAPRSEMVSRQALHLTWWFIQNVDTYNPDRVFILEDLAKKMLDAQVH